MSLVLVVLIAVLFVLVVLAAVLSVTQAGVARRDPGLRYEACGPLLTAAELAFYPVLAHAARVGREPCFVMCKVRLGDLIRPERGLDRSASATLRNRINQKHADFVVVRVRDFGVVAVVELDDASHRQKKRQERDGFVDAALGAAGVPVVHVPCARGYSLEEVTGRLWGEG